MAQLILLIILVLTLFISITAALVFGVQLLIKKLKNTPQEKVKIRLKRTLIITGGIFVAMFGFLALSQHFASTPKILDQSGKTLPGSIAELRKVDLNGRQEWISIRGNDSKKPVLLFLAGGPGGSQMAAARIHLKELEKYFVVVNWDQPGSCKSYNSVSQRDLTIDTYIQDGYELSKYLCSRFNQDKIYLVGESWGSALGIFLSEKHPEMFYSFIGTGQMVDFVKTEQLDYEKALEIATEKNDTKLVEKLKANGLPPYYGWDVAWKSWPYVNCLFLYMNHNQEISGANFNTFDYIFSSEYGILDKINYMWSLTKTYITVYPQLYKTDLRRDYAEVKIPVYFFEGRYDVNAPTSLAEDYYQVIKAPKKELVWFNHSGHSPWVNESDKFVKELLRVTGQ